MSDDWYPAVSAHALAVLEYAGALDLVARNATSDLGAEAVRDLMPDVDDDRISTGLRPVAEMMSMISGDEGWGLPVIPDLREPLRRLRVEGSVW
ncbi:MAG: hypothetical protein H0U67_16670, partial [Gemmatimonadetes bacterium]|nr:hypothetical protein [Gemmatimonadota bacterium]